MQDRKQLQVKDWMIDLSKAQLRSKYFDILGKNNPQYTKKAIQPMRCLSRRWEHTKEYIPYE